MKYYAIVICWLFILVSTTAQQSDVVKQLEKQRKEALAEIESTNRLLNEAKQTTKNSLGRLNLLTQQILSRKKVIGLLNQEIGAIDGQMTRMGRDITRLEKELASKRTNYGKSIQSLYKRQGSQDKLLFILSSESFAQSLRRMRYLREFADWQKRQATDIIAQQQQIQTKRKELEKSRSEKSALLGNRQAESQKLVVEENQQKEEVQQLNKKQKQLQTELGKKRKQADALNRQVEQQIAAEIARAEAEARAAREKAEREQRAREKAEQERRAREKASTSRTASKPKAEPKPEPKPEPEPIREERVAEVKGGYAMTKAEKQLSDNFANNRGRLPYPVTGSRTIVSSFGEQQHQELKHVRTNNSGIDIQTSPGGEARAIFNGEVTRVFVVPGYNNSIIIRHGNYLSVYSNLSEVYVKAGDRVTTRQAIGRIFSDVEEGNATILHFQIWKEKSKLNPTPWLD